jgi:uncharacterized membrane protein
MGASDASASRTFGAVVRDIGGNVDRIVRAELRYAIAQVRVEMGSTANASRIIAAGAMFAMLAAAFALLAAMFALSRVMPTWLASLAVAAVAAAAAAVLIGVGRKRFARQRTPALGDVVYTPAENK